MLGADRDGAADQGHFGASGGEFFGQGIAHFAGRIVADKAHGVNLFVGGAGRDEGAFAGEGLALGEEVFEDAKDVFRLLHAAFADEVGGQLTDGGFDDVVAVGSQQVEVGLSGGMCHHVEVHGRGNEDGGFGR